MNKIKRSESFSEIRDSKNDIEKVLKKREKLYSNTHKISKIKFNDKIDVIYFKSSNPSNKDIVIHKENLRTHKYEILRKNFIKIYQNNIFPHLDNLIKLDKKQFWENVYTNMLLEDELNDEKYKDIAKQRIINKLDHLIETSKLYTCAYIGSTQIPLHIMKPIFIKNRWIWQSFPKKKITKHLQKFKKFITN